MLPEALNAGAAATLATGRPQGIADDAVFPVPCIGKASVITLCEEEKMDRTAPNLGD